MVEREAGGIEVRRGAPARRHGRGRRRYRRGGGRHRRGAGGPRRLSGDGVVSPEHWVGPALRVTSAPARRLVATARGPGRLPSAAASFAQGALSEDQAGPCAPTSTPPTTARPPSWPGAAPSTSCAASCPRWPRLRAPRPPAPHRPRRPPPGRVPPRGQRRRSRPSTAPGSAGTDRPRRCRPARDRPRPPGQPPGGVFGPVPRSQEPSRSSSGWYSWGGAATVVSSGRMVTTAPASAATSIPAARSQSWMPRSK